MAEIHLMYVSVYVHMFEQNSMPIFGQGTCAYSCTCHSLRLHGVYSTVTVCALKMVRVMMGATCVS